MTNTVSAFSFIELFTASLILLASPVSQHIWLYSRHVTMLPHFSNCCGESGVIPTDRNDYSNKTPSNNKPAQSFTAESC